ncbi:lob domain-containing protein 39 [Quercus suber]|uniref:Lob domain-containing protein 39 n=1 Tax=Quercus suber TaxID=58331 RepID=A0AAW0M5D4_QUESU
MAAETRSRSCPEFGRYSPKAQGNAVLFLAKFFGRSDIIAFVSAVPEIQRPALFQSLLFEACGRTVNPVDGSVGLLARGKWHVCQTAVDTVLAGGTVTPLTEFETLTNGIFHDTTCNPYLPFTAFMQDAQPSDPALTLSLLLFEACGRTVNPVDGSVGLLARGKWHVCQTAVDTVLAGGTVTPLTEFETLTNGIFHDTTCNPYLPFTAFMQDAQPSDPALTLSLGPKKNNTNPWNGYPRALKQRMMAAADTMSSSFSSEVSEMTSFGSSGNDQKKVLNLFF